jgi:hypothetical protein
MGFDDGEPASNGTSLALLVGDSLVVYISGEELTQADLVDIDADQSVEKSWTRIEMPILPANADYDMSSEVDVKFSQEVNIGDPIGRGTDYYVVSLVAGQEGFTGYVKRSSLDDVDEGSARVWYRVVYNGTAEFTDGVFTPFTLDSANDSVLVPETP